MAKNFSKLLKHSKPHIQESQRTWSRINTNTQRHIVVKLLKTKNKNLETAREKRNFKQRKIKMRVTEDLSETMQARRRWRDTFKILDENSQTSFKKEDKILFAFLGQTEVERMHCQQTCMTKNVKEVLQAEKSPDRSTHFSSQLLRPSPSKAVCWLPPWRSCFPGACIKSRAIWS